MPNKARILFLDTENAPNRGFTWGKYQQDVIRFDRPWFFLCFGAKWQGDKKTKVHALPDYPGYSRDKENDRELCKEMWRYLDEADIVIGHNLDRFDLRKANARFAVHGLPPPSPYKTVDTLKLCRKRFQFDSNRLGDVGTMLGLGGKLPHTGAHLWFSCQDGDKKSWDLMRRYCARDVTLLHEIYDKLKAWSNNHPDLTHYSRVDAACPVCEHRATVSKGWKYYSTGKKQRRQCKKCFHTFVYGKHIKEGMDGRTGVAGR